MKTKNPQEEYVKQMLAEQGQAPQVPEAETNQEDSQQEAEPGEVPPSLKTYLVKMGIATIGYDDYRENFEWKFVLGYHLASAIKAAWQSAGFNPDARQDTQGDWIEYDGTLAFRIKDDAVDVDARSVYWIKKIRELPPGDAMVLRNYLTEPN